MRYLTRLRQGLGAGVIGLSVTLGLLGPAAAPAQAAPSRQTPPAAQVSPTDGASSAIGEVMGPTTVPGTTAAARSKKLQLSLTRVTPTALTYEDELVIAGSVTNPGNRAIKNLTVDLRVSYPALDGRDAVTEWVEDGDVATTSAVLDKVQLNVPAGGTQSFTLTRDAGDVGMSGFGPRPFSLVATTAKGRQLDVLRSTLVWAPEGSEEKVGLSMMAALTSSSPSTTAGLPTEEAAAELLPGSRLSNVLDASQDAAIGWAVDPALLAAAKALRDTGITEADDEVVEPTEEPSPPASGPTPTGQAEPDPEVTELGISDEAAGSVGESWINRISAGRKGRTVIGLPYADTDLNSVLKGANGAGLLRQSDKLGEAIEKEALGKSLFSRIAWPADGVISDQALDGLAATRHDTVILSEAQQKPNPEVDHTPSGTSVLRTKDKTLTGLLYDEELSGLFAGSGSDRGAETTQTMLATLAAISAESAPGDETRQLLAVSPRDWAPEPGDVKRLTSALNEAPWVELSNLKTLGAATGVDRENNAYGKKTAAAEMPKGNLSTAQALDRALDSVAPALVDNQAEVRRLEQRIASLLSFAWRSDLDTQADARRAVAEDVDTLAGGVQLLVGSESRIFTARSAPIQVVVDNQTAYPVQVAVSFRAASGQLKITQQPEPVKIEAGHRQTFRVEARAIATGDVQLEATLLAGDGTRDVVIGSPKSFEVKVRPNWETWGLMGMGVLLGLLLLIGLLRSFRRNRKRPRVPLNTIPDVDDEVTRAARKAAKEAAARRALETAPIARIDGPPETGVTDDASPEGSGGATNRTQQGSTSGSDTRRPASTGSASATPASSRGMHDQKSSSVPTMTAKGAERRSPTMPKENR